MHFEDGFRVDLLVKGIVVVDLKSVENLAPAHSKQVLSSLRDSATPREPIPDEVTTSFWIV